MSSSYSISTTETFTIVHARYIASKVATDLMRFKRFYNSPPDEWINNYEAELIHLLKHDVVENVIYGFKREEKWTEATIRYTVLPDGTISTNDDPGKIRPGLDIVNASFTSLLTYNSKWLRLSSLEQAAIKNGCPIQRSTGSAPMLEVGYWADDLSYSAGGRGLGRSTIKR